MYSSKYSKTLTIVLIIVIILIIGLLIFWGVDTFRKYNINNDAEDGISAFKNQIASGNLDNNNNNITDGNVTLIDPYGNNIINTNDTNIDENTSTNSGSSSNGSSSNSSSGAQYKGYDMAGYIEIPKTNIKYPILEEMTIRSLETSVAIMAGVGLNEVGNTVIAGHNYRNGLFFSDNAKLENGDKIYITDAKGNTVTYIVYKKYMTTAEDGDFVIRDTNGAREITLATCNDDSQKRIIIWAKEE